MSRPSILVAVQDGAVGKARRVSPFRRARHLSVRVFWRCSDGRRVGMLTIAVLGIAESTSAHSARPSWKLLWKSVTLTPRGPQRA